MKMVSGRTILWSVMLAGSLSMLSAAGQDTGAFGKEPVAVIPRPLTMVTQPGSFAITAGTVIAADPSNSEFRKLASVLAAKIKGLSGHALQIQENGKPRTKN